MLAGGGEAAGAVDVDGGHSELVPSAGPDVGQLDALLCSLGDRWRKGKGTWGSGVTDSLTGHMFAATSLCFDSLGFSSKLHYIHLSLLSNISEVGICT